MIPEGFAKTAHSVFLIEDADAEAAEARALSPSNLTVDGPEASVPKATKTHVTFDPLAACHECPICLGAVEYPMMLVACGHIFCQACIFQWLNVVCSCPTCKRACKQVKRLYDLPAKTSSKPTEEAKPAAAKPADELIAAAKPADELIALQMEIEQEKANLASLEVTGADVSEENAAQESVVCTIPHEKKEEGGSFTSLSDRVGTAAASAALRRLRACLESAKGGELASRMGPGERSGCVEGRQNPEEEFAGIQQVLRGRKRTPKAGHSSGHGRKPHKRRKQRKRSERAAKMLQQGLDISSDEDNPNRSPRRDVRDISAQVVIGAYTGPGVGHLASTSAEHFDPSLFSQSKGINSGFVEEDPWQFSAPSRATRDLNRRI
jgi:hypothetical protein